MISDRKIVLDVLTSLSDNYEFSNLILRNKLRENKQLTSVSRGFITEIVNGVVRNLIEIDYVINQFSKISLNKMKPCIKNILRMSVYQILKMRVPDFSVVNEAVNLTKQNGFSGLSGFVNGVLRNIIRNIDCIAYPASNSTKYLSVKYSFPTWLIELFVSQYGLEFTEAFCEASNMIPDISLSVNSLKIDIDFLYSYFEKKNISVTMGKLPNCLHLKKPSDLASFDAFDRGLFFVQDESSMLGVAVLDPQPFDTVLDICAAPGGKSFRIAQMMNNKGTIVSRDKTVNKVRLIEESAMRLGIDIIKAEVFDATVIDESCINAFDRILVDAPCSGLGLFRKKPDIKYSKSIEQIEELVIIQREILKVAVNYLKPCGVLVYSTCTLTNSENIENVKWIVNNLPLALSDITPYVPPIFLSDTSNIGYISLFPNIHNTDGFFIARFTKIP